MSCPSYLVIGHVSMDLAADYQIGGSFTYAAMTARNLGERVGGITSAGPDVDLAETLPGVDVIHMPSTITTTFQITYAGKRRRLLLRAVASNIGPEQVPEAWRAADIVHLAPIAQEVSPAIVSCFPRSFVGVTPQGWMRRWNDAGRISKAPWRDAEDILRRAQAVVLSEEDVLGGKRAIRRLADLAQVLVVTRGAAGADLYLQGKVCHFPAFAAREVDPTGAGDTFAAAFFVKLRHTGDPFQATHFANCVASFVVEAAGLRGVPTPEQIDERLKTQPAPTEPVS